MLSSWSAPARALPEGAPPPPALPEGAPPPPAADSLQSRLRERVARPGGLTSDVVARRAVATSTESRSREADVESAEAEVDRARLGYYPRLGLTARYTRLSPVTQPQIGPPGIGFSFPVILDQYVLQAGLVVPLSDYLLRTSQTHTASLEQREATLVTREAVRRAVATQARVAYYGWARARLQQAVTEQAVAQATRHLEMSRAARDSGRLPDVEVLRAESLLSGAELLDERTRNAARLAEARLHTLMHDEAGTPLEIGENLLARPVEADPGDLSSLMTEALRARPEMRAFARSAEALSSQKQAADGGRLPRLDAFASAYLANPSARVVPQEEKWRVTWDVGVQATWSPNDLGTVSATARSIEARRKKLDAERAAVTDAIRDDISGALLALSESRAAGATAERGLLAAEEAYRVRRELSDLGRGTSVELVDAETEVLRARLEMIQARVDARIATVRLDHAVGRDVLPVP